MLQQHNSICTLCEHDTKKLSNVRDASLYNQALTRELPSQNDSYLTLAKPARPLPC